MLRPDEESCRIRLEQWRDRLDAIMDLYPRSGLVSRRQLEEIRIAYSDLRLALQDEHHLLAGSHRLPPLTIAETQCYQPAVREAFMHLVARTNDTAALIHSSLFDAYTDFEDMLAQLQAVPERP